MPVKLNIKNKVDNYIYFSEDELYDLKIKGEDSLSGNYDAIIELQGTRSANYNYVKEKYN